MYKLNSDKILFTQLGDEGVVYDKDNNEYLSLNETSFQVLKSIENGKSLDEIVFDFVETYNIEYELCKNDVLENIDELLKRDIILKN